MQPGAERMPLGVAAQAECWAKIRREAAQLRLTRTWDLLVARKQSTASVSTQSGRRSGVAACEKRETCCCAAVIRH